MCVCVCQADGVNQLDYVYGLDIITADTTSSTTTDRLNDWTTRLIYSIKKPSVGGLNWESRKSYNDDLWLTSFDYQIPSAIAIAKLLARAQLSRR